MKFYTLYFRNYIFIFFVFIFTMLIISVIQSETVATASGGICGMADIPIGKSTKEPMGQFIISPVAPDKSPEKTKNTTPSEIPKKSQHNNIAKTMPSSEIPKKQQSNKRIKTMPPSNIPEKQKPNKRTKTVPSSKSSEKTQNNMKKTVPSYKTNKTLLPSLTPESVNQKYLYLSDYFLHLSSGDTYTIGISLISQENAINNNLNKNNEEHILDKINIRIISCNIKEKNTGIEIKDNNNINNKKFNKVAENKILSVKDNCITAQKEGIAVIVFYLEGNSNIKKSCTVRVTK